MWWRDFNLNIIPVHSRNLHLISWDLTWMLKLSCLLHFFQRCNKSFGIFNAKLRLCTDKPDVTVKWAFLEPCQPCRDLNKTKRRPRNKQDNYGLGCLRLSLFLLLLFHKHWTGKSRLLSQSGTSASVQWQMFKPWQMKMNLSFVHSLKKKKKRDNRGLWVM